MGFRLRTALGNTIMGVAAIGIGGVSIWFVQVVPLAVAALVLLPGAWFGMRKAHAVASRLNGIDPDTGRLERGGLGCSRCLRWCLRSADLDEPCNCPCPDHDWES